MSSAPLHLLAGDPRHGVTRCATELAEATGAPVSHRTWAATSPTPSTGADSGPGTSTTASTPLSEAWPDAVHLHVTDRLLADTPAAAAEVVERLATQTRLTLTLHDVPQPTDGTGFPARRAAYTRMLGAAHAWVTSSEHELALLQEHCGAGGGHVVPLALMLPDTLPPARAVVPGPTVGLFGHVYPGKGHREVLQAVAALTEQVPGTTVVAIGAAAAGHERVEAELHDLAGELGVALHVTGWLPDEEATALMRGVGVGVSGHRNLSASGSINSWVAAGRRPLVRESAYAHELERLRPGSHRLYRDEDLAAELQHALAHPGSTWWEAPGTGGPPGPDLAEVARRYLAWWESL